MLPQASVCATAWCARVFAASGLLDTEAARLNFQTVATCRARAVKHVLRSVARGTVVVRSGGMDGALDAWRTRRRGVGLRAAPCLGALWCGWTKVTGRVSKHGICGGHDARLVGRLHMRRWGA